MTDGSAMDPEERIIIHVDMDAFYASVEVRDNPSLAGRPLIIGSLPHERGVVSTCSYEAREFGVHSAMNIKEAYRLCPQGVFMRPDFPKYKEVSAQLHEIWDEYSSVSEAVALDEAYLDVTDTAGSIEKAREFAQLIKRRTREEVGLTCSVGLGYCMAAAKTASEEMKPNGYYEILTPRDFMDLVIDRDVRVLYGVGTKTGDRLHGSEIHTVRDILERQDEVLEVLGSHGQTVIDLAQGKDDRRVTPYSPEDAKSISHELTFQENVSDFDLLEDVLLLLSMKISERAKHYRLHGNGVLLKITYNDMRTITRSKVTLACEDPLSIHREAVSLLETIERRPIRLIGVGLYNLMGRGMRQMSLDEIDGGDCSNDGMTLSDAMDVLSARYELDFGSRIDRIYGTDYLHRIVEYMRKYRLRNPGTCSEDSHH